MSRHRDVRAMKYSDEYDGYDDVYGHSVEDDYCISPSAEQFMFDRNKQQNIASFFTEPDIEEDNEEEEEACGTPKKPELSEIDTAKLVSCIEVIRNVIGDSVSEAELTEKIMKAGFNAEVALDEILKSTPQKKEFPAAMAKDRVDSQTGSSGVPLHFKNPLGPQQRISLVPAKTSPFNNPFSVKNAESPLKFGTTKCSDVSSELKFSSLSALIANHSQKHASSSLGGNKKPFGTLADLTQSHLQDSRHRPGRASNFVIPKLSLKPNDSIPKISSLNAKLGVEKKTGVCESVEIVSQELVHMEICSESGTPGEKVINPEHSTDKSTEKTNEFLIDLTSALRETKNLSLTEKKNCKQSNKHNLEDLFITTGKSWPSSMAVESFDALKECEINLSRLQFTRLSHSSQSVSLFGKILCRKWRSRKPSVKSQHKCRSNLKIFDFSSPSPDSLVLAGLRRN